MNSPRDTFLSDNEHMPHTSSVDLQNADTSAHSDFNSNDLKLVDHSTPTPLEDDEVFQVIKIADKPDENENIEVEHFSGKTVDSRLVIVSWKIRQFSLLNRALKPGVIIFQYKADASLQSILTDVKELLKGDKCVSLAFICHGNPGSLTICKEQILSYHNIDDTTIKDFFNNLISTVIERSNPNAHLDLLSTSLVLSGDGQFVVQALQDYIQIPVIASKDILGSDIKRSDLSNVGELYFNANLLRTWSGSGSQSISNYEKIRTIGRGAYGTAVLYRKKDDDSLVVLKEITIIDLNATERQASMNEVKVLSMLSHPNIVSYYDSFDEDGILWIEMEYADGGTLHEFLAKQESDLEEKEILIMFSQMVSALKYCHDNNILHRDLKTQNIFLTQEAKVKLGDFGIAKIMTTHNAGNFTVVGTPYYISPEMCEGKPYDSKSDIWALGCILYEMANLTRTFDGTNLPALITKIVKGTFAPIKETYTPEFRLLVRDLLQKDPTARPNTEEILFNRLAELLQRYDDCDDKSDNQPPVNYGRTRSLLYYCDVSAMQLYPIFDLPVKIQIAEVSIGLGHIVGVSIERGIYTWGDNSYGQLGHGDLEPRENATEVVLLRGKSVVRSSCGDYFSTFLSDNGLVLTCGQGEYGCLGHGDWNTLTRPKLVDELLTLDIVSLTTGSYHLAVTTAEGEVYTWGCGEDGRLGHGNEENYSVPTKVKFVTEHIFIKVAHCSSDGTVFIADTGSMFACGRNQGNKLGLNPRQGFLLQFRSRSSKNTVEHVKVPTLIKDLCKYQISDIQFGATHIAMINEQGRLYTNGSNTEGQLACGNTKPRETISVVKGFEDGVSTIACGSTFSLAGVQETIGQNTVNSVYFWGTKPSLKRSRTVSSSDSFNISRSGKQRKVSMAVEDDSSSISDVEAGSSRNDSDSSFVVSSRKTSTVDSARRSAERRSAGSESSRARARTIFDDIGDVEENETRRMYLKNLFKVSNMQTLNLVSKENVPVVTPQLAFKFKSIGGIEGYSEDEEFPVVLQEIKCFNDHVVIHLETTAPPPKKKKSLRQKSFDSSYSSANSNAKEESSENSELETSGEIPTWIKNELEEGIVVSDGSSKIKVEKQPVYVDSGHASDDEEDDEVDVEMKFQPVRSRSFDSMSRRSSVNAQSRDPNFNIVPKLKKMGSLLKIQEEASTETKIIDGVAITSSIAEVDSPRVADNDENNNLDPLSVTQAFPLPTSSVSPDLKRKSNAQVSARSSDEVEYTTVKNINLKNPNSAEAERKKIPKEKPVPSKARLKRTQQIRTNNAYTPQKRNIKEKRVQQERVSSASDADDRKDKKRVKPMSKKEDEEKKLIEEIQRQAKVSEEKLREEIQKIQEEKEEREVALKKMHDLQLQQREELNKKQEQEAKKREQMLKNEIHELKSDLNNQNSKLQDNYNILLSLQEQLLRMQQSQIKPSPQEKQHVQPLKEKPKEASHKSPKSSVCLIM